MAFAMACTVRFSKRGDNLRITPLFGDRQNPSKTRIIPGFRPFIAAPDAGTSCSTKSGATTVRKACSSPGFRVHIVDDDAVVLDSLDLLMRVSGHHPLTYGSGPEFLEAAQIGARDLVLFDLHMPELDGFSLMKRFRQVHVTTPALLMTGHGDSDVERRAAKLGFSAVLHKPFSEAQLMAALDEAAGKER